MCGIAGYFNLSGEQSDGLLDVFDEQLKHRGPDGVGRFVDGRVGLLHRRLAILDKAGGAQPFYSSDGRFVVVFNGEIYNYKALREELTELGHKFKTHSDTEVLTESYAEWDEACFDKFNGMFAVAIYDKSSGELVLARDHFGIKPLYYAKVGGGIVFASEPQAIFATGLTPHEPNDRVIYRYLKYRVQDDTEETFFAEIKQLRPSQQMRVSGGKGGDVVVKNTTELRVRHTTYSDFEKNLVKKASREGRVYDNAAIAEYDTLLSESVRLRLQSDVPIGTALSGGMDSSSVVALIRKEMREEELRAKDSGVDSARNMRADLKAIGLRQKSFSAVFPGQSNDETKYVDAMVDEKIDDQKIMPTSDEFERDIYDFVRTQGEPVISSGPYAQYAVMREAGKKVRVMLDGQGADETLAGYNAYYFLNLRELFNNGKYWKFVRELFASLPVLCNATKFWLRDKLSLATRLRRNTLYNDEFLGKFAGEKFEIERSCLKKRLAQDLFKNSIPSLLRYEDRNTMRFAIEGRVPFLDRDLVAFSFGLDGAAIISDGYNKKILRDAMRDLLPEMIVRRRNKIGFTTPEDKWIHDKKKFFYEIFLSQSFADRPYFNRNRVVDAFEGFLAGANDGDSMLFWRIANVELWLRAFFDNSPKLFCSSTDRSSSIVIDDEPCPHCDNRHCSQSLSQKQPLESSKNAPNMTLADTHKSNFVANDGKEIEIKTDVGEFWRFPIQTTKVSDADKLSEFVMKYVTEFWKEVPSSEFAAELEGKKWAIYLSEKIVAITQKRSYFLWDIKVGRWARFLSSFVIKTGYGIGLGSPFTMQLAINEVGLPKILHAAVGSVIGKVLGHSGVFYDIAGPEIRAIDGPTEYSVYPANVSAKLAPKDPNKVANEIVEKVKLDNFTGVVVIDSNDIGRNILGRSEGLEDKTVRQIVAPFDDNPLGQAGQQTPIAIVFY
ncbi:MAG: asparagine synthase (glutamine-hydrolyzing) [Candidatus Nomurabacteria bacterium]|jgi:asparagine synthase (glutamine-hydrolysing)|nr:asparagine synthase (glutamine-hydrolyzing) [Candidatus Nomurabacteria bacterium]